MADKLSPIFTYNGQGTKKRGVNPRAHGIAYSQGYLPTLLDGECRLEAEPICKSIKQDPFLWNFLTLRNQFRYPDG